VVRYRLAEQAYAGQVAVQRAPDEYHGALVRYRDAVAAGGGGAGEYRIGEREVGGDVACVRREWLAGDGQDRAGTCCQRPDRIRYLIWKGE
jgi:hypothetical protein